MKENIAQYLQGQNAHSDRGTILYNIAKLK